MGRTSKSAGRRRMRQNPPFPQSQWWKDPTNILPGLGMISIHEDENTGDYFREYGFINDYVVRVFPSPDDMFRDDVRLEYWLSYALPGRNYPAIRPLSQLELRNLGRYLGGTFPPGRVRPGRALFDLLYNVGSMRSGVAD